MGDAEKEVWDVFDDVMDNVDKMFKPADKSFRTMGRVKRGGVEQRVDGKLVVSLTWRNRLQLIRLAFCRAKRVRF